MKSRGKNLNKACQQAIDYTHGLKQNELPKFVLVCDFYYFRLYDTEEQTTLEFTLNNVVQNIQNFGYLLGYQKKTYKEQDPVNIKAPELMVKASIELDRAVDASYSKQTVSIEAKRMELLFELYEKYTAGLFVKEKRVKVVKN